ncbi:MAG: pre-peptidase C-terminal domain-containing protein, partial [Anaerolineales bacterium]|nr:pre-peptidase C-terminal domain-containing protein [Anaerolineales bacterium]
MTRKKQFGFFTSLLLMTLLMIAHWQTAYAESEPNDSFATADPIDVGLSNAEVGATLTTDDYDYYVFTAVANHTYIFETYNIQGTGDRATGIWLYDNSQTLITHDQYGDNGTGNANARIVYTFSTSGTYFVLVKDCTYCTWTGTYSLRILPKYDEPGAEWDAANDNEPNDVLQLANEIQVGLQNAQTHLLFNHSNYVTNNSDHDFYRFTAEAGRTYVIETFNIQGTGDDATGLWLYDTSGALITSDQYGNNGTGNANARIIYTFSTSGTYFILAKDCTYCTWTGTYSLRILPKFDEPGAAWNAANDNEPNDVLVLANQINVGVGNTQAHQLFNNANFVTNDSDFDYYHFTAEAGKTYIIQTLGIQATGRATGLWLYNDLGTLLVDDKYGDNSNGTAEIVYTFVTSGEYIFLVKDAQYTNWTGTYSVRVCEESC